MARLVAILKIIYVWVRLVTI